jgi:hypothetical protein
MSSYQEKRLSSTIVVPSSSSYLNIDTRDQLEYDSDGYIANSGNNPFDITIYRPDAIFQGRVLRMALTQFNMLYTCPNVNPYNNILVLQAPGFPSFEIILQPRFTNAQELADSINGYLTGNNPFGYGGWSCSYFNNVFEISCDEGTAPNLKTFRVNPMFGKFKGYGLDANGKQYLRTSTLASIMGFTNASKVYAYSTASDVPSMQFTRYIDIVSNELTSFQYTRDFSTSNNTGRNLIARIFLNKNGLDSISDFTYFSPDNPPVEFDQFSLKYNQLQTQPFTINYEPTNVKYMKWDSGTNLSNLNIRILDEFGNLFYDNQPSTSIITATDSTEAGSASYCQMTFTVSEGDN